MSALPFLDGGVHPPCWDVDPEVFFPSAGEDPTEARRVCGGCPVRMRCAVWAVRTDQKFGVWGGLTERERRAVAKRLALRQQLLDERYATPSLKPADPDPPALVAVRRAVLLGEEA